MQSAADVWPYYPTGFLILGMKFDSAELIIKEGEIASAVSQMLWI